MSYKPHRKTALALARGLELVDSVPYQVSIRWLFYRLLQEGFYSSKDDYNNRFLPAISAARHDFYNGWRPDTLADDTREPIVRGNGDATVEDWLARLATSAACVLDKWQRQSFYVELWYEARAMSRQFEYYTRDVTLRPLGGQPSIPYKWETAKAIERAGLIYNLPVVVLYFGDLDSAGENIAQVVERDVRGWCGIDFKFISCGLNADQVRRYNVPENPEKPGEYQWEALPDEAAREIIMDRVSQFVRPALISEARRRERQATEWVRLELVEVAKKWQGAATL